TVNDEDTAVVADDDMAVIVDEDTNVENDEDDIVAVDEDESKADDATDIEEGDESDADTNPDEDVVDLCGNGFVDTGEDCDDVNADETDFCKNDCTTGPALRGKVLCTGLKSCYGIETNSWMENCPVAGESFYGQDAQYEALDFCLDHSYTVSGTTQEIVTDNVTGLIWQRAFSTSHTWQAAMDACDTLDFAGQTDWRLPNRKELVTLLDYYKYAPATDTTAFPDTPAGNFWSSSISPDETTYAMRSDFMSGITSYHPKTSFYNSRCVRGASLPNSTFLESTVVGKVIVTDVVTGLLWTKEYTTGLTWSGSLSYCENLNYGGFADWRLPNIEELKTLVDDTVLTNPTSLFPGLPSDCSFWSSTTWVANQAYGYYVAFSNASSSYFEKTGTVVSTICVR
ncbi:MAG TPA: DUF1566 domain-containing protein, partial [bacterium]|nr:DUF1566 domain-containing protein [bacterium]